MQHRALRAECRGDAGNRIGESGPGGGHHATESAALARVAIGGVGGHLLVVHVDDADAFVDTSVVNVDDVTAAQGKDGIDAFVLEGSGDKMPAGDDICGAALLSESVCGGVGTLPRSFRYGGHG